ncbi:MAG: Benzylsuccinate synthase subunit A [Desulfotomaculum sp. 46_80]|nr:MAG: Benzylsuccinate synthase subunit A [Desulfotomaculum sp. 46_80]
MADKAVISWARRHARLCRIVAESFETDPVRREELLQMAEISQRLWDVMQMKWYVYLMCHAIKHYASGMAHKEDKLCWPYYKAIVIDKTFQTMTHKDAVELFECERLKCSEHGAGKSRVNREIFPGSNDLFILTIGGLNRDGMGFPSIKNDALNDQARTTTGRPPKKPTTGATFCACLRAWPAAGRPRRQGRRAAARFSRPRSWRLL